MSITFPASGARHGFPVVVHVLVRRSGSVLLLQRARTGHADGMWSLPGGHLEAGEPARAGALRELAEETGLVASVADLQPLQLRQYHSGTGGGFNLVFELAGFRGEPRLAEPATSDAVAWFGAAALPAPLVPWVAELLAGNGHWYDESGFDRTPPRPPSRD